MQIHILMLENMHLQVKRLIKMHILPGLHERKTRPHDSHTLTQTFVIVSANCDDLDFRACNDAVYYSGSRAPSSEAPPSKSILILNAIPGLEERKTPATTDLDLIGGSSSSPPSSFPSIATSWISAPATTLFTMAALVRHLPPRLPAHPFLF